MGSPDSLRRFGQVFDDVADAYDEARPGYPEALVDAAIERGGLSAGSRVLEVGCGTGKLTELLSGRGLIVDAVDPGPNMIEAARRRIGGAGTVRFHVARFEDVSLSAAPFAALFSATAFHWIEPAVAWRKAAASLEPGGLLALLTHIGLHDERSAETEKAFRANLRRHAPEVADGLPAPRDLETIRAGIEERRRNASDVWDWIMGQGAHALAVEEAAGLFDAVDTQLLVVRTERTADQFIARLRTTSLYFRIDPARREAFEDDDRRLVEHLGGTVVWPEAAVLMTARRVV